MGLEGFPPAFLPRGMGTGEDALLAGSAPCLPGPSPSTRSWEQAKPGWELSAVLTGVGPAGPEREAQIGSEMTMQHLHPGVWVVMRAWRGKHCPGTENAMAPRFCV